MSSGDVIMIYMTCATNEEAVAISEKLLQDKLVACSNILASHQALYWWEGKIENSTETAVIFKTTGDLFQQVQDEIIRLHSYDCPCIVSLPIEQGASAYLQWVRDVTAKDI